LVARLANAEADGWEHFFVPSFEIRCSCVEAFLQWDVEDAPVYGKHEWATCACHGRDVLCCLTITGARLDETVRVGGVCGCTPIFPEGVALCPEECNKLARPSFA
jgi:hypothetical protein